MRTSNKTDLVVGDQFLRNTTTTAQLSLSSAAGTALVFLLTAVLFFFLWVYYICCTDADAAARSSHGRHLLVQLRQQELRRMTAAGAMPRPPVLPALPLSACVAAGGLFTTDCVICLSEFEDKEEVVKVIPGCRHVFHRQCIDQWLASHGSCPVCRCTELVASSYGGRPGGEGGGGGNGGSEQ